MSSRSYVDISTTIKSGRAAWICRAASIPPIPGMWMSINTMSASPSRMSSTADSPVSHSPAITKSSIASRVAAVARRKPGWSSTTQTRTHSSATGPACQACLPRTMVYTPPFASDQSTRSSRSVVVEEHQHSFDAPINSVVNGQLEFGEDRIDVLFHRPLRQHQPLRNRSIAEAGCQFAEHLAFPGSQPAQSRDGTRLSEQRLNHQRIEHRPTARHLANGLGELVEMRYPFLQEISPARRTALQQTRGVARLGVVRQHDYAAGRMRRPHPPCQSNPFIGRRGWHANVGDQNRRSMLFHELDR